MSDESTHKLLNGLKLALGVVLVGGGAAFSAGTLAVKATDDRVTVTNVRVDAVEKRVDEMQRTTAQAQYDAQRAAINTEALLKWMGAPVPNAGPKPAILLDGGRDGG